MKIGSFEGVIPKSRLPHKVGDTDIAELIANLIGISARDALPKLPIPQFSFLLTAQLLGEGLNVGLTCHVKPFYESYRRLLVLFFEHPQEWKKQVEALPLQPSFSGSIRLGQLIPHRLIAISSAIRFESSFARVVQARFPANTSSVITWVGLAANSAVIHFDPGASTLSLDEIRLYRRFADAVRGEAILAFDELSIDDSNPEVWTWDV